MTPPKRTCAICDITISGCPGFHPGGRDAQGQMRYVHMACASRWKAEAAARAERLEAHAEEMLAAIRLFVEAGQSADMEAFGIAFALGKAVLAKVEGRADG